MNKSKGRDFSNDKYLHLEEFMNVWYQENNHLSYQDFGHAIAYWLSYNNEWELYFENVLVAISKVDFDNPFEVMLSWRGFGGFIADWVNQKSKRFDMDYMDYYMSSNRDNIPQPAKIKDYKIVYTKVDNIYGTLTGE